MRRMKRYGILAMIAAILIFTMAVPKALAASVPETDGMAQEGATIDSILAALEAEKQSYSWREENGRFIPGIVKWLGKETWRSFVQQAETVEEDEEWTSF